MGLGLYQMWSGLFILLAPGSVSYLRCKRRNLSQGVLGAPRAVNSARARPRCPASFSRPKWRAAWEETGGQKSEYPNKASCKIQQPVATLPYAQAPHDETQQEVDSLKLQQRCLRQTSIQEEVLFCMFWFLQTFVLWHQ